MSDNELGLFLRTRRESVSPARVGLQAGPRRRTPGLRRAELATLAGVSVEYITRLEQGRDRHPSPAVLSALGDALLMTPSQRIHLHRLSKSADSGFHCLGDAAPPRAVRPAVRAVLDRLDPSPAVVFNRLTDILAYTDGYHRVMASTGLFDVATPNLAKYLFTDPRAETVYPDWDAVADEVVATLKQGPFRVDRHIAALVDELTVTAGPAFADRVATVPSLAAPTGITRFAHPQSGELRLAYETLELSADDDQRLIVHLPADQATARALDALTRGRPGGLRVVRPSS
ncbi:helix-turn-helix domain-containing protein [Nocardia callitridis]|uniref:Helix-turn-helix transcriptional regulator n=1 Tax=Nocardia callitridis TaxID=648753 RepID=A0ABP9L1V4_9NOCA